MARNPDQENRFHLAGGPLKPSERGLAISALVPPLRWLPDLLFSSSWRMIYLIPTTVSRFFFRSIWPTKFTTDSVNFQYIGE